MDVSSVQFSSVTQLCQTLCDLMDCHMPGSSIFHYLQEFAQINVHMASGPITSWETMGKQWKQYQTLFFWAPKSLQMVTEATKLKDTYFLEEKL